MFIYVTYAALFPFTFPQFSTFIFNKRRQCFLVNLFVQLFNGEPQLTPQHDFRRNFCVPIRSDVHLFRSQFKKFLTFI